MKILLFGDFSAVHKNLQEALKLLGHKTLLVSSGDGFKKIKGDISFSYESSKLSGHIIGRIKPFIYLPIFTGFDVVQLINPYYLKYKYFPASFYYDCLKRFNKKFFVLAAGSDPYFWRYGRLKMRYGPFEDTLKYDMKKDFSHFQRPKDFIFNEKIVSLSNGIISDTVEYDLSYEGHPNLKGSIPMPVNMDKIKYSENIIISIST